MTRETLTAMQEILNDTRAACDGSLWSRNDTLRQERALERIAFGLCDGLVYGCKPVLRQSDRYITGGTKESAVI